jgi:heme/copper-type cytochrome/quinol oxidase subunit 3
MKAFFLTGSIIFTVLILILAFENMGAQIQGFQFLFTPFGSAFFIVIGLCTIGVIAGALYTGLILSLAKGGGDEEPGGNEW